MLILCHELGHHLGGYPKNRYSRWASNEGQSDYFATMKGFREMTKNDKAPQIFFKHCQTDEFNVCCESFRDENEIDVCNRSIKASTILANVLQSLARRYDPTLPVVRIDTPSNKVVDITDDMHPEAQIRLDTMYNGSICSVSRSEPFSEISPVPGACSEENGDTYGFRPRSWYKLLEK